MTKHKNESNKLLKTLSWSIVLFWMGILFWFSSQPAQESARWSVGAMRVGRHLLSYWEWLGIIAFIIIYHIFLFWLSRIPSGRLIKICLFLLFIILSLASVYILLVIIRPRIGLRDIFQLNRWVIHRHVRKFAHFFIYLFLGSVLKNALTVSGIKGWKAVGWAIGLAFIYALTDEAHQYFVPGRMFLLTDVVIDTLGATVGVVFYSILNFLFQFTKK